MKLVFVFFKKNETKKLILVTNLHLFIKYFFSNPIIKYIFQIKKNKAQILSKYVIIIILNN